MLRTIYLISLFTHDLFPSNTFSIHFLFHLLFVNPFALLSISIFSSFLFLFHPSPFLFVSALRTSMIQVKKKIEHILTCTFPKFSQNYHLLFLIIFKINRIDVYFRLILVSKTSFVVCVSNDCATAVLQKWLSCGCSIPPKLKIFFKKSWFPFPIISFLSSTFSIRVLFNSLPFPSPSHFFFFILYHFLFRFSNLLQEQYEAAVNEHCLRSLSWFYFLLFQIAHA